MWPFSRRRRYNGDVAAILPALGVDMEEAGVMKLLNALDIAWAHKYSLYEAALLVSYSMVGGLRRGGDPRRARWLLAQRVKPIKADWIKKGIVRAELVGPWEAKASRDFGQASPAQGEKTAPAHEPSDYKISGSMPDVTKSDAARGFLAGNLFIMLVKDVPPVAAALGLGPLPISLNYIYAMVVHAHRVGPLYFVTLEQGAGPQPILGVFGKDGSHSNLGTAPELLDEAKFVDRALTLIREEFRLSERPRELKAPPRSS